MATSLVNNSDLFEILKGEYNTATSNLKEIDESIKKITGRDPAESRQNARRSNQAGGADFRNRDRQSQQGYAGNFQNNDFNPNGRGRRGIGPNRLGGRGRSSRYSRPHNDESPDEDEPPRKVTLQSSVVATPKEVKSRKDTIETQKGDKKVVERNRRMFGMILGTLQKFQSEESKRKDQFQKRVEIEQKLEEAANKEKEEMRKERQGLFLTRREKQAQMRRIEQKLQIVELHDEWEKSQKFLLNFIMTKCASSIAYKPKKTCPESEKRLKESQERILENIRLQKEEILSQLAEIDELYHKGGADEEEEMDTTEPVKGTGKENLGPPVEEVITTPEVVVRVEGPTEPPKEGEPVSETGSDADNMGKPVTEIEGGNATNLPPADGSDQLKEETEAMESTEPSVIDTECKNLDSEGGINELKVEIDSPVKPIESEKPLVAPIGDQEFEPIYD